MNLLIYKFRQQTNLQNILPFNRTSHEEIFHSRRESLIRMISWFTGIQIDLMRNGIVEY